MTSGRANNIGVTVWLESRHLGTEQSSNIIVLSQNSDQTEPSSRLEQFSHGTIFTKKRPNTITPGCCNAIFWKIRFHLTRPLGQAESWYLCVCVCVSDQRIVNFPANRNRNRFAEPTSIRIAIGIVREFQN